jgi:hypothetical protein
MKKTANFIQIIIFLFCFSFIIQSVYAEDPTPTPAAGQYGVVCIKAEAAYKKEGKDTCYNSVISQNIPCEDFPAGAEHPSSEHDHELRIAATGLPRSKTIYLVSCIGTTGGSRCTTGNETTDAQVQALGYKFTPSTTGEHQFSVAGGNPVTSDANGSIRINVRSWSDDHTFHSFFGVFQAEVEAPSGNASTLQYGTFNFESDQGKCVSIRWDPKGRVFDSKSLEPLSNVSVSLLDSLKKQVVLSGVLNPVITITDGIFNFFVPNGTYFLSPVKNGYIFPVDIVTIHKNYSKAYFCDPDVKQPIYNKQYEIIEQNKIIHCDVPMDPGTNTPYRGEVTTIAQAQMVLPNSFISKYEGTVSHPLTKVTLIAEESGKKIVETSADKFGAWSMLVYHNKYPVKTDGTPDRLIATYTKVDLTVDNPVVSSTKKAIIFEPIPRYIEGKAEPFAQVGVRLQNSDNTQFLATADDKGFFAIAPQKLPLFPYSIIVGKSVYTPTQYEEVQKEYLKENKIDVMNAVKNDKPLVAAPSKVPVSNPSGSISQSTSPTREASTNPKKINEMIMLVAILIILIMAVGGSIYFFIKQKKNEPSL